MNMDQPILVIAAFVRNVHLRRALQTVEPEPTLNFWRVMYGNCTDMAAIDWCKLFGSNRELVQWKRVVPKSEQADFKRALLADLGVTRKVWRLYRDGLKSYRDKFAAHHDPFHPEAPRLYPIFDLGLEAAAFYYGWILKDLDAGHRYPPDLQEYGREFAKQAVQVAQAAMAGTAGMTETVI
jgi:hypothetical protein